MGGLLERPEWKSTQEFTRTGSSYVKQDSRALRVFCVSRAEKSSIQGREPAAAEEKSGTEGSKKNWPPIRVRFLQHLLKSGMQGRATHGRTKIAGNTRNGRKRFWRNTALLGKQGHQAGIRLVGRETADGTSPSNCTLRLPSFASPTWIAAAYCPAQPKIKSPRTYFAFALPESALRSRKALAPSPKRPPNSPATRPGVSVRLCTSAVTTRTVLACPETISDCATASALSNPRHAPPTSSAPQFS